MPEQTQVLQLNVLFMPQHHEPKRRSHKKSLRSSLNWFHYEATTFPFCCSYCRTKTFSFKLLLFLFSKEKQIPFGSCLIWEMMARQSVTPRDRWIVNSIPIHINVFSHKMFNFFICFYTRYQVWVRQVFRFPPFPLKSFYLTLSGRGFYLNFRHFALRCSLKVFRKKLRYAFENVLLP